MKPLVSEMTYAFFHPRESVIHFALGCARLDFNPRNAVIKSIYSFVDMTKAFIDLTEAFVDLTKALLGLLKTPTDQPLKTCELPSYARSLICRTFLRHLRSDYQSNAWPRKKNTRRPRPLESSGLKDFRLIPLPVRRSAPPF
jgi:hypothetical protein